MRFVDRHFYIMQKYKFYDYKDKLSYRSRVRNKQELLYVDRRQISLPIMPRLVGRQSQNIDYIAGARPTPPRDFATRARTRLRFTYTYIKRT